MKVENRQMSVLDGWYEAYFNQKVHDLAPYQHESFSSQIVYKV